MIAAKVESGIVVDCIVVDEMPEGFVYCPEWVGVGMPIDAPRPVFVETPEQVQQRMAAAVQRHLDETAKTRGYDDIVSACSYAGATNPFQAEGVACIDWRSEVWAYCYGVLAAVQAGTRTIPTEAELLGELPAMQWPAAI